MLIPIIKNALRRDDSKIILTYINRVDTSIPVIASNDGTRPAIMEAGAGLQIVTTKGTHILLAVPVDETKQATRADLLIPENTSKQFFFFVNPEQRYPDDPWQSLANDLPDIWALKGCVVSLSYLDFSGELRTVDIPIFGEGSKHNVFKNRRGWLILLKLKSAWGRYPGRSETNTSCPSSGAIYQRRRRLRMWRLAQLMRVLRLLRNSTFLS